MKASAARAPSYCLPRNGADVQAKSDAQHLQGALAEVNGPQTYYEDDERGDGHSKPGQVLPAPGQLDEHTAGFLVFAIAKCPSEEGPWEFR